MEKKNKQDGKGEDKTRKGKSKHVMSSFSYPDMSGKCRRIAIEITLLFGSTYVVECTE